MEYKDYYQILDVNKDASQVQIKQAYRKLARKYHPDVSSEANAEEKFKELGEAYEVLKDPEKRTAYDQLGSNWKDGQNNFQPPPDWGAGFEFHDDRSTGSSSSAENFSDFFQNLFGKSTFNKQYRDQHDQFSGYQSRGNDSHAKVYIELEEAYFGTTRSFTLKSTIMDEKGRPIIQERNLNVKIPKGVRPGQNIRLQGQGSPGIGGAGAGDLYLEVEFNPHSIYKVELRDVSLIVPITPWEAALGSTIKVPTPAGKVDLKIPPCVSSGKRIRFKGRGVPAKTPGDFYVILEIVLKQNLTDKEKELYQQLMTENHSYNPRSKLGV